MPISDATSALLRHLASRPGHDEVKADFRQLLVEEFGVELGDLEFERRVPEVRGRLDALIGRTVFEAKSDLDREWQDVERRLPDYLADREREEGERFVGIASDGLRWAVFELASGKLTKIKETILNPDQPEGFLAWLDGATALKASLPPEPLTIRLELGEESIAFRRASADLTALWATLGDEPAVVLKRQLWASLLKLVYGREIENDTLWIQHTFLVIVAKCVALAVLEVNENDPARVLSGRAFQAANIYGAVESDFFDWVVATPEGEALVRRIMAHVRRFRLKEVETDVLKVLYESLIDREERHGLGEYYTPDWLAAKIVREAVERPTEQRVLDPACGSGTFLFHAVRRFLADAEDVEFPPERRASEATALVAGMDIHPVAVIIARVTYLLALAPALAARAGSISIPVYLGDSMQLSISRMMAGKELTIRVPPPSAGKGQSGLPNGNGGEQLDFPETFCRDPALFDKAIERMRSGSEEGLNRKQIESALHRITEQHYRRDVTEEERYAIEDLGKTFLVLDRLRRENRDSVWAYVARNLSRPLAYSAGAGWANVIVGNPPWLAFRHMSADLQTRFKQLARDERVYVGGKLATQNDLSALFTVRASALYLRSGGTLAFVLPLAALTRGQFERFRTGSFTSVKLAFEKIWTMDDTVQPLFPVPSCVVFCRKRRIGQAPPETARRAYSGSLPYRDAPEDIADRQLTVLENAKKLSEAVFEGGSVYRKAFRQGATLVPRFLCLVERKAVGRLGADTKAPAVMSRRSRQEKRPWKDLPSIEGRVESEFLRPVLLGESILPFRVWRPFEGVIPVAGKGSLLNADAAAGRGYAGLAEWLRQAEHIWSANAPEAAAKTFSDQLDYYGKLRVQFPVAKIRLVYAKAGTLPASCLVREHSTIVDHKLYWASFQDEVEARYLSAIFNSEASRSRIAHTQSRGQWGARDFDKVMFNLPIPRFDRSNSIHRDLAIAAEAAEEVAASVEIPGGAAFQRARHMVRDALNDEGVSPRIDELVERLLEG